MRSNSQRYFILGLLTLSAIPTTHAQQLKDTPAPKTEIIREKATGKLRRGRIHELFTGTIQFTEDRFGAEREKLLRENYEIVYCDGLTNGMELLKLAEERAQAHDASLALIESQGADAARRAAVTKEISSTKELLKRIQHEFEIELKRRQPGRWDRLTTAVDTSRVQEALQRNAALEAMRENRLFQQMIRSIGSPPFKLTAEIRKDLDRELRNVNVSDVPNAVVADVANRLMQQVNQVVSNVGQLRPAPRKLAEPSELKSQIESIEQQLQALKELGSLRLLGEDFLTSVDDVDSQIKSFHRLAEQTLVLCRNPIAIERAVNELAANHSKLSFQAATVGFERVQTAINKTDSILDEAPNGEPSQYATRYLQKLRSRASELQFDIRMEILRNDLALLKDRINQVTQAEKSDEIAREVQQIAENAASLRASARLQSGGDRKLANLQHNIQSSLRLAKRNRERINLDQINAHLVTLLEAADSATLSSRVDAALKAQQQWAAIAERVETLGESRSEIWKVQQLADSIGQRIDSTVALLQIHQPLAQAIKSEQWSTEELEHNRQLLKEAVNAHDKLKQLKNGNWEPFDRLVFHTRAEIEDLRRRIDSQAPQTMLSDVASAIDSRYRESATALELGELARGKQAFDSMTNEINKLTALVSSQPALESNETYQQAVRRGNAVREELEGRIEDAVTDFRLANGWFQLPMKDGVLVAPTAENRVLEMQLLIDQGRLDEATSCLSDFRAEFVDPKWHEIADSLSLRIQFQRAIDNELTGDIVAARNQFASLAERPGEKGEPLTEAARSAVIRLDHLLGRTDEQRNDSRRLSAGGLLLFFALGALGWYRWQNSETSRLRRGRAQIERAQLAITEGDLDKRDECLRRAGALLADFSETHPKASELRNCLRRPQQTQVDATPERAIEVAIPDASEAVRQIVAESTSIDDVQICVDWLRGSNPEDPLWRDVIRWLRQRLRPASDIPHTELVAMTEAIHEVRKLAPQDPTLQGYELASLYWSGEKAEARHVAKQMNMTKWSPREGDEIMTLVLGICLIESKRYKEAETVLNSLCRHPTLASEANRWLLIEQMSYEIEHPSSQTTLNSLVASALS